MFGTEQTKCLLFELISVVRSTLLNLAVAAGKKRENSTMKRLLLAGGMLGLLAMPAMAIPVLDQSSWPFNSTAMYGSGYQATEFQQQFTVGITGKLTEIDLMLGRYDGGSSSVNFSLAIGAIGGHANNTWLAWQTIATGATQLYKIDLSSLNINVTANEKLVIDLTSGYEGVGIITGSGGGLFNSNQSYAPWNSWSNYANTGNKLAFQTFVDPPETVPLPAALPLFGAGLLMMGLFARRRNRQVGGATA